MKILCPPLKLVRATCSIASESSNLFFANAVTLSHPCAVGWNRRDAGVGGDDPFDVSVDLLIPSDDPPKRIQGKVNEELWYLKTLC
jgi:hypothetical protein